MEIPRIIDAHIHQWDLWKTPREPSPLVKLLGWNRSVLHWTARKVFPKDAVDFFGKPDHLLANYLPHDYLSDVSGANVAGFVHVEAGWRAKGPLGPVGETRWLEELATPHLKAIVGYADLALGEGVDEVLRAHMDASPRFRGVRYALSHHPNKKVLNGCENPGLLGDSAWRKGYALLARYGLSFDATVYHHQLDDLAELARAHPDVPMVVCHAGTPTAYGGTFGGDGQTEGDRQAVAESWRRSMGTLAELPQVSVKISGLAMPILGWSYHTGAPPDAARVASDIQPIVDFLVDHFGAERCMFASNFPIDLVSMPWSVLYEAFAQTVRNRTEAERDALFYATASRFYRLED